MSEYFTEILSKPVDKTDLIDALCRYLPYSTRQNPGINHIESNISKYSQIEYSVEALDQLQEKMVPWSLKLRHRQPRKETRSFSTQIEKIGNQYQIHPLIEFSKSLTTAVEKYDIPIIRRLIFDFPELINQLKSDS